MAFSEVQIKTLVQIFPGDGGTPAQRGFRAMAGGIGRSTDRPLTVGVDVDGQHAAPEARLEWQTRHGRTLRTLGMDPCQLLLGCRRDGLGDRRRRRPGQEPDRRLPAACGKRLPAVNLGKCGW